MHDFAKVLTKNKVSHQLTNTSIATVDAANLINARLIILGGFDEFACMLAHLLRATTQERLR